MTVVIICVVLFILYALFSFDTTETNSQKEAREKREREEAELRIRLEDQRVSAQSHLFKHNWKDFQKILEENKVFSLFHFTDRSNLHSIKHNDGLFSWNYCEKNGINVHRPNSTNRSRYYDKEFGLENFVRLSFTRDNPMMFVARKEQRIQDPVVLEIDRLLLYKKDTLFSNINADSHNNKIEGTYECFSTIEFSVFSNHYFNLDTSRKKFYLAEVLVRQKIPLRFIKNIDKV